MKKLSLEMTTTSYASDAPFSSDARMATHDPRADELQRTETFGGNDHFALPYRRLPRKQFAWLGLGVGAFVMLFMIGWISGPLAFGVGMIMKGHWFGAIPIAFSFLGIMGLRFAFLLVTGSLAIMKDKTRTTLSLDGKKLRVTEEFFRFKWRRKCKLKRISKLRIIDEGDSKQNPTGPQLFGRYCAALEARDDNGNKMLLAVAYPRELLLELAEALAKELDRARSDLSNSDGLTTIEADATAQRSTSSRFTDRTSEHSTKIEVIDADDISELAQPVEQPNNSNAVLTKHDAGIQIELPPTGFKGGAAFLTGFGTLWTAFSTLFVFLLLKGDMEGEIWIATVVVGLFEVVGIGLILAGVNSARKKAALVTASDQLMVVTESLFGKKREQWHKSEIYEIHVGDSDYEVNDRKVQELQIHNNKGIKSGFLSNRDDDELAWIAWELNSSLELERPEQQSFEPTTLPQDELGRHRPHPSSPATIEHFGEATQITIPPRGFRPVFGFISTGLVFVAISIGAIGILVWTGNLFEMLVPIPICALFTAIGIWSVFYGYVLAHRGYVFEVSPERIVVTRTGFMSDQSFDFPRDSILVADIVDSGTKINNRSLKQLRISSETQHFAGMTDHPHDDLSLVALTVQEAMTS